MNTKDMLSTKQLADQLGFSRQAVTYMARNKKIPFYRVGHKFFFPKEVVKMLVQDETGIVLQ